MKIQRLGNVKSPRKIRSCEEFDRGREKTSRSIPIVSMVFIALGLVMKFGSATPLSEIFIFTGIGVFLYGIAYRLKLKAVDSAYSRWLRGPGYVQFGPSAVFMLGDLASSICITIGCIRSFWMLRYSGVVYSMSTNRYTWLAIIFFVSTALLTLVVLPIGLPVRPEIVLDPRGIHIWPYGVIRNFIPWDENTRIVGIVDANFRTGVEIELITGRKIHVPLLYLPLGGEQFQRVITFYGDHPEMRNELANPIGLKHVRTLMHTPKEVLEDMVRSEEAE